MEKNKFKNVLIGMLVVIIVLLLAVIYLVYTGKIGNTAVNDTDNSVNNNDIVTSDNKLSDEEAMNVGQELYDKATEIYEVWVLRPYCGVSSSEIQNQVMVEFDDAAMGKGDYYDSGFASLEALKSELRKYLSDDIINSKITSEAITDTSLLKNIEYNDYVLQNGKLYCRAFTGKGFMSRYLGKYDMEVSNLEENKITYTIKSTYVTEEAQASGSECWNSINSGNNNCADNELEYKSTTFTIEKNNDNWVVTSYTLHD